MAFTWTPRYNVGIFSFPKPNLGNLAFSELVWQRNSIWLIQKINDNNEIDTFDFYSIMGMYYFETCLCLQSPIFLLYCSSCCMISTILHANYADLNFLFHLLLFFSFFFKFILNLFDSSSQSFSLQCPDILPILLRNILYSQKTVEIQTRQGRHTRSVTAKTKNYSQPPPTYMLLQQFPRFFQAFTDFFKNKNFTRFSVFCGNTVPLSKD